MKIYLVILVLLLVVGCKNKSTIESSEKIEELKTNNFSFTLNAIIEHDDNFVLYYLDENEKDITKKHSIEIPVIGSTSPQVIKFQLKDDILPKRLLLMFGNEAKIQKVQIIEGLLEYDGIEIVIDSKKFYQYFIPNEYINYDDASSSFTSTAKNEKYNPTFFSRKVLEEKIDYTFY